MAPGDGGFTPNRKFSAILSIFFKFAIFIFLLESMLSIISFSFLYMSSRKLRFASESKLLLLLLKEGDSEDECWEIGECDTIPCGGIICVCGFDRKCDRFVEKLSGCVSR